MRTFKTAADIFRANRNIQEGGEGEEVCVCVCWGGEDSELHDLAAKH